MSDQYLEEKLAALNQAIAQRPDDAMAHFQRGVILLHQGNLAEGWREYEWRWRVPELGMKVKISQPLWTGQNLAGRRLLVYYEQGLGDTIQFVRYVPMVAALAARLKPAGKVILVCQQELHSLLKNLPGPEHVFSPADGLPPFDFHCPLMNLPRVFGTTLANIPASVPYIGVEPARKAHWNHLPADKLKIGLAWEGDLALARFGPLADIAGAWFCNLQRGAALDPPIGMTIANPGEALNDFAETAALIENLDLVISTDSVVAHLAGALGKPVWVLLPEQADWRWMENRADSPWYPTMRLFRKTTAGWESAISQAAAALRELLKGRVADNSENPQAAINSAIEMQHAGRLDEAEAVYRQVLARHPGHPNALNMLGILYAQRGQDAVAAELFRRAIAIDGQTADYQNNLGIVLERLGRLDDAGGAFRKAIILAPESDQARSNMGNLLRSQGKASAAIEILQEAIRRSPNVAQIHYNLGNAFMTDDQVFRAVESYRRAAELGPDLFDAHQNLSAALFIIGEPEGAMRAAQRAVELRPNSAEAFSNLGVALADLGKNEEAIASYDQALRFEPELPSAHWNRSLLQLKLGRYREGWIESEWGRKLGGLVQKTKKEQRWFERGIIVKKHDERVDWPEFNWDWRRHALSGRTDQPWWDGASFEGKRLLLHYEQGLGDTLQFIRYVPLAARRGGKVLVIVPRELLELFESQKMPGVERWFTPAESLPEFDLHCPLLSLPRIFDTTLETIPGEPYLRADPVRSARWKERLPRNQLKIGLVWAGKIVPDPRRSMRLEELKQIAGTPGVFWVSLQVGEQSIQAKSPPAGMKLNDWTDELKNFADTAALIDNLDLVISIDTSVAHLAGAMGKGVWIMVPKVADWRYLIDRADSPWYPSMRIFRQKEMNVWSGAVDEVALALRKFVGERHAG